MPQMSPLIWDLLLMYFFFTFIMMLMLYFFLLELKTEKIELNNTKSLKNKNLINWLW